jgi:hypothetical protein
MSSLDQSIALTPVELKYLDRVEAAIVKAVEDEDDSGLINIGGALERTGVACALSLARLLFLWNKNFDKFDIGEEFVDYIHAKLGRAPQTTRKYIQIWSSIFENSQAYPYRNALMGKGIQSLLLIAPAASEGLLKDNNWEDLANAPDKATISKIIKEITGGRTSSSNALVITLKRDGTLVAVKGNTSVSFGYLNISRIEPDVPEEVLKIITTAIDRICRVGIVRE